MVQDSALPFRGHRHRERLHPPQRNVQTAEPARVDAENLQGTADGVPGRDRVHSASVGSTELHASRLYFQSASCVSIQSPGGTVRWTGRLDSSHRGATGTRRSTRRSPAGVLCRTNDQHGLQISGHGRQTGVRGLQTKVASLLQHLPKNTLLHHFKELF